MWDLQSVACFLLWDTPWNKINKEHNDGGLEDYFSFELGDF